MENLKVDDLREICRKKGYKGFSKYKKSELIEYIRRMIEMEVKAKETGMGTETVTETTPESKPTNHTERLGRTVEYYLAKIYLNEGVDAIFKEELVDLRLIERDAPLFEKMKSHYPYLMYIGNKDHKYDFKYIDIDHHSETKYVSVKTNFNGNKVCPQVIGQTTLKKFVEYFKMDLAPELTSPFNPKDPALIAAIKSYIVDHIGTLLKEYLKLTLHCDLIYYYKDKQKKKSYIRIIRCGNLDHTTFDPSQIGFSHLEKKKEWNESTTVYYTVNGAKLSIGEFQVHNHRNNIKFRWNMVKLLEALPFPSVMIVHD